MAQFLNDGFQLKFLPSTFSSFHNLISPTNLYFLIINRLNQFIHGKVKNMATSSFPAIQKISILFILKWSTCLQNHCTFIISSQHLAMQLHKLSLEPHEHIRKGDFAILHKNYLYCSNFTSLPPDEIVKHKETIL